MMNGGPMKFSIAVLAALAMVVASCGSDDDSSSESVGESAEVDASAQTADTDTADTEAPDEDAGDESSDAGSESEPVGPAEPNTIQIGSQVWERTLPMTTGQCFLYEDDGTLPTSATVWGTLDGDEELGFLISQNQDGTLEAELDNNFDMYWIAGYRGPDTDDLVIELDFEAQTIIGSGTFTLLNTGETVSGSFEFVCSE
jgi:hypothetical protein